jgi:dihydroorotase/N-acyl-D-amino-acid deacylase
MFDTIIENGTVIDGTGAAGIQQDVGITGKVIGEIGNLAKAEAGKRINAAGRIISPGFIDLHTHSGLGKNMNLLQQGVTLMVGGNCGFSSIDFSKLAARAENSGNVSGPNLVELIGHNDIRSVVMGNTDRRPSAEELEKMKQMVANAMRAGAIGFSTGLAYTPGSYAKTEEIIELAKAAAEYGGFYATHMRNEGDYVEESVEETIRIGRESSLPAHISHYKTCGVNNWGKSRKTIGLINQARSKGLDITLDQYPYTASYGTIFLLIPAWAAEGDDNAIRARLADSGQREKIRKAVAEKIKTNYGTEPVRIILANCAKNKSLEGKTLAEIAGLKGYRPDADNCAEIVLELIRNDPGQNVSHNACIYESMSEQDVMEIMKYPFTAIGSDGWGVGISKKEVIHPRLYGTFPRVLGRYCREMKLFRLEEAIRKMTGLSAQRLGLKDRGVLKKRAYADIVVFDQDRISDIATFAEPHQYPVGIDYVMVNGKIVIDHGKHTGELPGVFIKRTLTKKVQ